MIPRLLVLLAPLAVIAADGPQAPRNANRLAYRDEDDPFYVGFNCPRLATPR